MPPESVHRADAERPDLNRDAEHPAQAWLHARARLMPNLLSESPPWVRGVFDHSWAPMRALVRQLHLLPPQVWSHLLCRKGGFAAICSGSSHYTPGPATIRHQQVTNVAFVSVEDLALDNERPLHALAHLIDHYLGCDGYAEGLWLSEGGGTSARWREAGQRLAGLFALGYAVDPVARSSVRDYFAQSLALYCRDRQRLNVADPQIYRWLRTTLWSETYWQEEPDRQEGNEH